MRKPLKASAVFSSTPPGVAAWTLFATIVATGNASAQQMSASALKQKIPGAVIHLDTPLGSVVPISYAPDGTIEGKAGAVAFYLGSEKDRGKWWIEGSSVCHQWSTWFDGKRKCLTVNLKPKNRLEWADQDGGTGTATIIAFGNVEQPPPQQVATLLPQPALAVPSLVPPQRPSRLGAMEQEIVASAPQPPPAPRPSAATTTQPPPLPQRTAQAKPAVTTERPARLAPAQPQPQSAQSQSAQPQSAQSQSAQSLPTVTPRISAATPITAAALFRVVNVAEDDVLNVRREPSPAADIVAGIAPRTIDINVTGECRGDWCPVQSGRQSGWVHRYFLARADTRDVSARPSGNAIFYKVVGVQPSDVLNVRQIADGDSEVIATIPATGTRIRLTGYCKREWCPVAYGPASGWVNRQFLMLQ